MQIDRPVVTCTDVITVRTARFTQIGERDRTFARHVAFDQRLVAAHIHDRVDVFDQHRAFLHAGAAGRAGPQRVRFDQARHERLAWRATVFADRNARCRAAGISLIRATDHARDKILNQLLRIERLPGGKRGARRFALAALHAGVEAQQLVPAKLDRLADAIFLRVEQRRLQRGRRDDIVVVALGKTLLTRVKREVQQTGERVLHRTATCCTERHRERAHRDQQRDDDGQRTRHRRSRQRDEQRQTERERPKQQRQMIPRPAREPCRHGLGPMPATPDEHRADQHHERCQKDQLVEPR